MKKITFSFVFALFCLFLQGEIHGQGTAMAEIYSGYGKTLYSMKEYSSQSFVPLGFRTAIGSHGLQLGIDYNSNIVQPTFDFKDSAGNTTSSITVYDKYFGLMFRAHMADDQKHFAVILRAGGGYYFSKGIIQYPNSVPADYNFSYKNSLGANGALGFSIPLSENGIHFTVEGQFNYDPRKDFSVKNDYNSWVIQAGISYNYFGRYNLGHY